MLFFNVNKIYLIESENMICNRLLFHYRMQDKSMFAYFSNNVNNNVKKSNNVKSRKKNP